MLQKQPFFLSLAGGIDTKSDSKQVIPGKLLLLENGIFTSPKEIDKRNGYLALGRSVQNNLNLTELSVVPLSVNNGTFITGFNSEIILNDSFNLYSYSDSLAQWIYKGKSTTCNLETIPVIRNAYQQTAPDSAINTQGIQLFAWNDTSGPARMSVIDSTTGQAIIANKAILDVTSGNATSNPRCCYINNRLMVFYIDSAISNSLYYQVYTAGGFQAPVQIVNDINPVLLEANYDIIIFDNKIYIAYNGAATVKLTYLGPTLILGTTVSQVGTSASRSICVFGTDVDSINKNIWVGFSDGATVKVFIANGLATATLLPSTLLATDTNIYALTGLAYNSNGLFFYDKKVAADSSGHYSNNSILYASMTSAGVASAVNAYIRSANLASKVFLRSFNDVLIPHVVITHDSALQPTYFLTNLYNLSSYFPDANIVAKIAESAGEGFPSTVYLPAINVLSDGIFQTAMLQKDLLYTSAATDGTVNTYTQTGVISTSFDFTETNPNCLTLGENLHIGSGILSIYDGQSVVEHGFHLYPENVGVVVSTSGGNLADNSSYGYQVTYEWIDNQGQTHRSSPSPVVSVTTTNTGNDSSAAITIPTLRITAKSGVNIVVYRTQANGTVYYRLNSPVAPLLNSTTSDFVVFNDTLSDAAIAANQQLYTTGGEVVNIAAPASTILANYKNRIILIPSDNTSSWWFSKQVIPGTPVEFSDLFVKNVDTTGGPITAVAQLDSNLILFKSGSIWYVVGDGPAPSGANDDFTDALKIASDTGCINPQSIVLTPSGLMYKSQKGIYLLDRSMNVKYIGADVEAYNSSNVTSSQLIISTNQARFTLDNGTALVYDYFVEQWSVFTNHNAVSCITKDNNFTYLQPSGLVLQETPGQFKDNGSFIKLKLVTSWLSLGGLQGFQRVYKALILGQYFGPHKLLVKFAYDFNPIPVQEDIIDVATILNTNTYGEDSLSGINSPYGGEFPTYQWRVFTNRQVCETVQITIEDAPVVGVHVSNQGVAKRLDYNEGMSLSAISLELGIKKGLNKISAKKSSS